MTSQPAPRRLFIRWMTLKGSIAILLFLAVAVFAEYLVVLYAIDLGVQDAGVLTIDWPVTIIISPLFHLVPIAVIVTLLFTWVYLTKKLSARTLPTGRTLAPTARRTETKQPASKISQTAAASPSKPKPSPRRLRGLSYLWERIHFARATIKSAVTVFVVFLVLVLLASLLSFPALIYQTITGAYQNNSLLYGFVVSVANSLKGFAETVSPIGWIAATMNNGLVAASPSIRGAGLALGGLLAPVVNSDPAGKYLFFQNAAAWVAVLLVLFYGEFARKSYRYRKK